MGFLSLDKARGVHNVVAFALGEIALAGRAGILLSELWGQMMQKADLEKYVQNSSQRFVIWQELSKLSPHKVLGLDPNAETDDDHALVELNTFTVGGEELMAEKQEIRIVGSASLRCWALRLPSEEFSSINGLLEVLEIIAMKGKKGILNPELKKEYVARGKGSGSTNMHYLIDMLIEHGLVFKSMDNFSNRVRLVCYRDPKLTDTFQTEAELRKQEGDLDFKHVLNEMLEILTLTSKHLKQNIVAMADIAHIVNAKGHVQRIGTKHKEVAFRSYAQALYEAGQTRVEMRQISIPRLERNAREVAPTSTETERPYTVAWCAVLHETRLSNKSTSKQDPAIAKVCRSLGTTHPGALLEVSIIDAARLAVLCSGKEGALITDVNRSLQEDKKGLFKLLRTSKGGKRTAKQLAAEKKEEAILGITNATDSSSKYNDQFAAVPVPEALAAFQASAHYAAAQSRVATLLENDEITAEALESNSRINRKQLRQEIILNALRDGPVRTSEVLRRIKFKESEHELEGEVDKRSINRLVETALQDKVSITNVADASGRPTPVLWLTEKKPTHERMIHAAMSRKDAPAGKAVSEQAVIFRFPNRERLQEAIDLAKSGIVAQAALPREGRPPTNRPSSSRKRIPKTHVDLDSLELSNDRRKSIQQSLALSGLPTFAASNSGSKSQRGASTAPLPPSRTGRQTSKSSASRIGPDNKTMRLTNVPKFVSNSHHRYIASGGCTFSELRELFQRSGGEAVAKVLYHPVHMRRVSLLHEFLLDYTKDLDPSSRAEEVTFGVKEALKACPALTVLQVFRSPEISNGDLWPVLIADVLSIGILQYKELGDLTISATIVSQLVEPCLELLRVMSSFGATKLLDTGTMPTNDVQLNFNRVANTCELQLPREADKVIAFYSNLNKARVPPTSEAAAAATDGIEAVWKEEHFWEYAPNNDADKARGALEDSISESGKGFKRNRSSSLADEIPALNPPSKSRKQVVDKVTQSVQGNIMEWMQPLQKRASPGPRGPGAETELSALSAYFESFSAKEARAVLGDESKSTREVHNSLLRAIRAPGPGHTSKSKYDMTRLMLPSVPVSEYDTKETGFWALRNNSLCCLIALCKTASREHGNAAVYITEETLSQSETYIAAREKILASFTPAMEKATLQEVQDVANDLAAQNLITVKKEFPVKSAQDLLAALSRSASLRVRDILVGPRSVSDPKHARIPAKMLGFKLEDATGPSTLIPGQVRSGDVLRLIPHLAQGTARLKLEFETNYLSEILLEAKRAKRMAPRTPLVELPQNEALFSVKLEPSEKKDGTVREDSPTQNMAGPLGDFLQTVEGAGPSGLKLGVHERLPETHELIADKKVVVVPCFDHRRVIARKHADLWLVNGEVPRKWTTLEAEDGVDDTRVIFEKALLSLLLRKPGSSAAGLASHAALRAVLDPVDVEDLLDHVEATRDIVKAHDVAGCRTYSPNIAKLDHHYAQSV